MPRQLRIYTINRGRLDDFARAWREGIYPLRLEQGFSIPAAWKVPETNQFVWVLAYQGEQSWDELDQAYYGSAARRELNPDPARWIARAEEYFVEALELNS